MANGPVLAERREPPGEWDGVRKVGARARGKEKQGIHIPRSPFLPIGMFLA